MIIHIVKPGESLSKIGMKYGYKASEWKKIWQANPGIKNPNLIYPGQKINVPRKLKASKVIKTVIQQNKPVQEQKFNFKNLKPEQLAALGLIAVSFLVPGGK